MRAAVGDAAEVLVGVQAGGEQEAARHQVAGRGRLRAEAQCLALEVGERPDPVVGGDEDGAELLVLLALHQRHGLAARAHQRLARGREGAVIGLDHMVDEVLHRGLEPIHIALIVHAATAQVVLADGHDDAEFAVGDHQHGRRGEHERRRPARARQEGRGGALLEEISLERLERHRLTGERVRRIGAVLEPAGAHERMAHPAVSQVDANRRRDGRRLKVLIPLPDWPRHRRIGAHRHRVVRLAAGAPEPELSAAGAFDELRDHATPSDAETAAAVAGMSARPTSSAYGRDSHRKPHTATMRGCAAIAA